ncbi:MAG: ribonuclease E/G [Lachnospiraceae bacterium]|nr:ribonuclease E/G [Lachnospiraceae bacterium]
MDDRIIICRKDGFLVTAVFRGKECIRLSVCKASEDFRIGNIYIGRVASIVPNMNACFADIGTGQNVHVPLEKTEGALTSPSHADGKIHVGDSILLQIDRLPSKQKAASATGAVSLVGNAVCLLQGRKGISFSKKIDVPGFREDIRALFEGKTGDRCGVMLRTNSVSFEKERILAEYEKLRSDYQEILRRFECGVPGACLYRGLPEYMTMFRDEHLSNLDEVVTDDPEVYSEIREYMKAFLPDFSGKLRKYDSEKVSLYHLYDLAKAFADALSRTVSLPSGGNLVFDKTEAMTVVDVNSGRGSALRKKNALHEMNLEAARELARQMRLRSLSGMILCDFISTDSSDDAADLLTKLREFTKDDRDTDVVDITKLGIVEITRQKRDVPLYETVKKLDFTP